MELKCEFKTNDLFSFREKELEAFVSLCYQLGYNQLDFDNVTFDDVSTVLKQVKL